MLRHFTRKTEIKGCSTQTQNAIASTAKLATNSDMETKAARSRANAVMINSFIHFVFFYSSLFVLLSSAFDPNFSNRFRQGEPARRHKKTRALTPGFSVLNMLKPNA
tara:strand:+ start:23828 stop:24148 length:321 start_codon:yes stop_codon:yes gene_type:complete